MSRKIFTPNLSVEDHKALNQTLPTIGFNVAKGTFANISAEIWDLGGQKAFRSYWSCYYENVDAIIFVIDSSDTQRLQTVKEEYVSILKVILKTDFCLTPGSITQDQNHSIRSNLIFFDQI